MVILKSGKIHRLGNCEHIHKNVKKKKENVACCSAQKCSRYPRKFSTMFIKKISHVSKTEIGNFVKNLLYEYIGLLSKNAGGVREKRKGGEGGRRTGGR